MRRKNSKKKAIFAPHFIMTAMKISSTREHLNASPEKVYNLFVRFLQAESFPSLPQVTHVEHVENGCRFTVGGMATCTLTLMQQTPYSLVSYRLGSDKGITATASAHIEGEDDGCILQLEMDAEVPFFLQGMLKGMMQNTLDKSMEKIKELAERM